MSGHLEQKLTETGVLGFHFFCAEDAIGPTVDVSDDRKASGQIKYIGPASQAFAFLRRAIGGWESVSGTLQYFPAYSHPLHDSLQCSSGNIQFHGPPEPHPSKAGEITWPFAWVTLSFKTQTSETSGPEANKTLSIKSNQQVIEIEGGVATFASGQQTQAAIAIPFSEVEFRVEFPKANSLGLHIYPKINKINASTFNFMGLSFPAKTIRLGDFSSDVTDKGVSESPEYRRSYVLVYNENTHTKELNKWNGNFEEVTIGGSGSTRQKFQTADLSDIFD